MNHPPRPRSGRRRHFPVPGQAMPEGSFQQFTSGNADTNWFLISCLAISPEMIPIGGQTARRMFTISFRDLSGPAGLSARPFGRLVVLAVVADGLPAIGGASRRRPPVPGHLALPATRQLNQLMPRTVCATSCATCVHDVESGQPRASRIMVADSSGERLVVSTATPPTFDRSSASADCTA